MFGLLHYYVLNFFFTVEKQHALRDKLIILKYWLTEVENHKKSSDGTSEQKHGGEWRRLTKISNDGPQKNLSFISYIEGVMIELILKQEIDRERGTVLSYIFVSKFPF